jgi:pimeloyl-ACP methyl ester carboxylesterase
VTKPRLLLLPGLLEDADAFSQVIEGMREVADCSVADLTRSNTIAGMARDVLAEAPEGTVALAGHSMGGYVALEVMRQAPGKVERLALLNTNGRPDSPESTENRRRAIALSQRDFPAVVEALLAKQLTPGHLQNTDITGTITSMALSVGKEAFARQQEANIGPHRQPPAPEGDRVPDARDRSAKRPDHAARGAEGTR